MSVFVVVPIYKVENYLQRCIESILSQTFTDFKLILVDDGSTDSCGIICDNYARVDDRIMVIHKANGGLSDARNWGIELSFAYSEYEWISFIDSDDWIHPQYLDLLYNAVKKSGCQISVCGFRETSDEIVEGYYSETYTEVINSHEFFCRCNVNAVVAWGKLYKKELFANIRFPFAKLHEDEFTTYRLLFSVQYLSFIRNELYYYFVNHQSITQSGWSLKSIDGIEAIMENIQYFYKNKKKYYGAYIKSIKKLEWGINTQLEALKKSEYCHKYDYYLLYAKYYRVLLRYGRKEKMYPFSKYYYYYEIAYPKSMKYYWIMRSVLGKFKER